MSDVDFLMERLAIEDLFARYAHTADGYDADGWVDCFTEDGILVNSGDFNGMTEDGIFELESDGSGLRFIGRQALDDFIRAHIRLLPGTRHVMTNHLVDFDGVRAQHRCTLTGMLS